MAAPYYPGPALTHVFQTHSRALGSHVGGQALEERVKYLARGSVYYDGTDSPAPGGSHAYD